ncbi:hypothetical protein [Kamptonema formosum]|uniref:hypothetical protein n=1 Tax=Kamptonema formosum TaxID=331992 RepID=UPI00034DB099|nr:hypothetical protein [Oscillatoria sp. PCC 10802]
MTSYIPRPDSEFNSWQTNFASYLSGNLEDLGLTEEQIAPIPEAQNKWLSAYNNHIAAQAAAESACQNKEDTRKAYQEALRRLVKQLQASPEVTDAQRMALGITVREASKRAVGVPVARPLARVDASDRLQHTIHFVGEDTPTRRAKPAGVMGCELWVKIGGAPPADPSELTFLGLDTATPYVAKYAGEHSGKIAHYMLRWVSTRGDRGPWSQTVSAMIPA